MTWPFVSHVPLVVLVIYFFFAFSCNLLTMHININNKRTLTIRFSLSFLSMLHLTPSCCSIFRRVLYDVFMKNVEILDSVGN